MIKMLAHVGILFHFVDNSDLRHIELTIFFKLYKTTFYINIIEDIILNIQ